MADGARVRAQIRCWGVRGTCPSPGAGTVRFGGNTPCVEVRTPDGAIVVLDGGTGLRPLGATLEAEPRGGRGSPGNSVSPEIDQWPTVFLFFTHLHCDHVVGLPHFAPMLGNQRDIQLRCGESSPSELQALVQSMFRPPLFPPIAGALERVSFLDWHATDGVQVGASCRVRRLYARHPGGASIITVEDEAGLILAYAPDNELGYASTDPAVHAWRAALAERLRGVPLLLHDATYVDDELPSHEGWGHSSANEAARFAASCHARELLLFHHHPDRTDDAVTQMVSDATTVIAALGGGPVVHGAMEGTTLVV